MGVHTERLKYIPSILYLAWGLSYLVFGISALLEDWGLADTHCGKTTHIFKYGGLVLTFACVDLITFVVFPGGGEGARARAIMLCGLYLAFAVWGVMMWLRLDDICSSLLGGNNADDQTLIFIFHHMATIHNTILLGLTVFHEVYLGPKLRCDLTLMPVRGVDSSKFFDGLQGAPMQTGAQQGYNGSNQQGYFVGNQGAGNTYVSGPPGKCAFQGVQEVPPDPENPPAGVEWSAERIAEQQSEDDRKSVAIRRAVAQPDGSSDLQNVYAGITKDMSEESKNAILNPTKRG